MVRVVERERESRGSGNAMLVNNLGTYKINEHSNQVKHTHILLLTGLHCELFVGMSVN